MTFEKPNSATESLWLFSTEVITTSIRAPEHRSPDAGPVPPVAELLGHLPVTQSTEQSHGSGSHSPPLWRSFSYTEQTWWQTYPPLGQMFLDRFCPSKRAITAVGALYGCGITLCSSAWKHDVEMQRLKQMWQRSCISALFDLLASFFSCLHVTLSFPCQALPSVLHSSLLFLHVSPHLTPIGLQFRELDLSWMWFLSLFLMSSSFIFPLLFLLHVLQFPLVKGKKLSWTQYWQSICRLTVGALGSPRSEACMTAKFCLGALCLRNHAGGDQMGVFNTVGSHTTLVQEHWVLSCLTAPNSSFRSFASLEELESPSVQWWSCAAPSCTETPPYISTVGRLREPVQHSSSVAASTHLHSLGVSRRVTCCDCTYIFTQHLCFLEHGGELVREPNILSSFVNLSEVDFLCHYCNYCISMCSLIYSILSPGLLSSKFSLLPVTDLWLHSL